MNKTEVRRLKVKTALNTLVTKFNAYSISNDDGARFDFFVDSDEFTFHGQLDRRDLQVCFYDSIPLSGPGFTAKEHAHQAASVELEDIINEELEEVLNELEDAIFSYEVNVNMGFRPDELDLSSFTGK